MEIQVSSGRVLANLLFEDHDALALFWRQYRNLFIRQLKHLFRYISFKSSKPSNCHLHDKGSFLRISPSKVGWQLWWSDRRGTLWRWTSPHPRHRLWRTSAGPWTCRSPSVPGIPAPWISWVPSHSGALLFYAFHFHPARRPTESSSVFHSRSQWLHAPHSTWWPIGTRSWEVHPHSTRQGKARACRSSHRGKLGTSKVGWCGRHGRAGGINSNRRDTGWGFVEHLHSRLWVDNPHDNLGLEQGISQPGVLHQHRARLARVVLDAQLHLLHQLKHLLWGQRCNCPADCFWSSARLARGAKRRLSYRLLVNWLIYCP